MSANIQERIEDITRPGHPDQLLTAEDVSKLLKVSRKTVDRWGRSGVLPRVVMSGTVIRYKEADVRQWIRERTVRSK